VTLSSCLVLEETSKSLNIITVMLCVETLYGAASPFVGCTKAVYLSKELVYIPSNTTK
jgi:hypothetical protein